MPKYYVVAGGIELLPVQYALAGTSFAVDQFDTVSSELLQHCLNQEFKFRACEYANTADNLVLFSNKKDAERFSGGLSDGATVSQFKKYYPIFEVEINTEYQLASLQGDNLYEKLPRHLNLQGFDAVEQSFNCCIVDEKESNTFKQNLCIIDIDLPHYERKEKTYFPKILLEEARRPFFDKNFFLWLGLTFWTVIIPIVYAIYRLLKSSDANAALIDPNRGKLADMGLGYTMYTKDKAAHFNWAEKPLQIIPVISKQPEPTVGQIIYRAFFPAHAEEERLKSMFPNLIFRGALDLSYRQLKDDYHVEECWNPKKYTLCNFRLPEHACEKGAFDGIKNTVTQAPMLEIFFYITAFEANGLKMPVSAENAPIIRQMIKVNYCGYFADKNGTPTKAGNMVTAELDKIEAALKTSLNPQN